MAVAIVVVDSTHSYVIKTISKTLVGRGGWQSDTNVKEAGGGKALNLLPLLPQPMTLQKNKSYSPLITGINIKSQSDSVTTNSTGSHKSVYYKHDIIITVNINAINFSFGTKNSAIFS